MLNTLLSFVIILVMIGLIIYFIYEHYNCKISYEMETESPYEKEFELQCNQKTIFNRPI